MAKAFTETMLSTAANIAPRAKRCQGPSGWRCSEETKAEMVAAWQEREAARDLLRADPAGGNFRRNLKAAVKRLRHVRVRAV